MKQLIWVDEDYHVITDFLIQHNISKFMLICGKFYNQLNISDYLANVHEDIEYIVFNHYKQNPDYESVVEGINQYKKNGCQAIVAIGGGSAIDVAKCIKLYCKLEYSEKPYFTRKTEPNDIPFVVMPTTAGTGSESTKYAVIYYNGEKQSITDTSCIPKAVFFDSSVLNSMPDYYKKSAALDALSHGIESYWSVNSTEESKKISDECIRNLMQFWEPYLTMEPSRDINLGMMKSANLGGQAINITQTTAGHAMCYKLTSFYGMAHGHAAALCVLHLWRFMYRSDTKCIDIRGRKYLDGVFIKIAQAMDCDTVEKAINKLKTIIIECEIAMNIKKDDLNQLVDSVNLVRLKNNPIELSKEDIRLIYSEMLDGREDKE